MGDFDELTPAFARPMDIYPKDDLPQIKNGKKKDTSLCSPRFLATSALVLLSLAVIGLFIVIIVTMNKQSNRTDEVAFMVGEMSDRLAKMDSDKNIAKHGDGFTPQDFCLTSECVRVAGKVMENMNMSQDPCDHFYEFACQGFETNPTNPQNVRSWSSLHEMSKINAVYTKRLLEEEGSMYRGKKSSAITKAKGYYKACLNQDEATSIDPLLEYIDKMGSWTMTSNPELTVWSRSNVRLEETLAKIHREGINPLFECSVQQDPKNATLNRLEGLYDDKKIGPYKQAIITAIVRVAEEMDPTTNSTSKAQALWDLDYKIAKAQDPTSSRTNVANIYHIMPLSDIDALFGPSFNMTKYLESYIQKPVKQTEQIVIYAPEYVRKLGNIIGLADPETLQNYLVYAVVSSMLFYLPKEYQDIKKDLDNVIYGSGSDTDDWEKCVARTVSALGFAAGGLFAEKHFTEEDKDKIVEMVELVRESFTDGLPGLEWMDSATKETAMYKATEMIMKIGYPDFVADATELDEYYENLSVTNNTFSNIISSRQFSVNNNLKNFGQPVDRTKWYMTPSIVNAYYNPSLNEMVFPAGILQEPLYNRYYPRAMIYGAIGMVIAHELTHGFDNNGRLFDADGNLIDWWHNSSAVEFEKKAQCFVDQYNDFLVYGQHVNGKLTLGENIADNGGIRLAYNAYKKWLKKNSNEDRILPGLAMSSDQMFYLGYAQTWCSFFNKQTSLLLLAVDPHSPNRIRADSVLMNAPDFSSAYSCSSQDRMNPERKCAIWT